MRSARVLVAPDKFKGSLSARDVAAHVAAGLLAARPGLQVEQVPVADGGDGTVESALAAGFRRVRVRAAGPDGRPVEAAIAVRGPVAVVELALASGLALVPQGRLAPLTATSRGAGELIRAALAQGGRWAAFAGPAAAHAPGAGAGGGVGFAALAVLGAVRRPGIEVMLDLIGLRDRLPPAGLVVTGEGALDRQTLHGKAPAGVAAAAREAGVPAIAVCGRCDLGGKALGALGIRRAYPLTGIEPDPAARMTRAGPLLTAVAARIAADLPGLLRASHGRAFGRQRSRPGRSAGRMHRPAS